MIYEYRIGNNLPNLCGHRTNSYTITELNAVNEPNTYAKYRFKAVDFSSKKSKCPLKGVLEHKFIKGWIDADGRWFN